MRISHASLAAGALALAVVALTGCGGEEATPTPEPTPEPIVVSALDLPFRYEPDALTIDAAGATTIRLVNGGTVEHDFTIDELDFQLAVAVGETADGTLEGVEPGTYEFYCTVPGHKENGMVGELVVTG